MKLLSKALTWFYPSRCAVCDTVTAAKNEPICDNCKKYLLRPDKNKKHCKICSLPAGTCSCGQRLFYEQLAVPFLGDCPAMRSVYKIKFNGRRDLIKPFAKFMKISLDDRGLTEKTDIITFIPMRRINKFKRGFNQAEELAKALAEETGIQCIPLLIKYGKTSTQHDIKSAVMRTGNTLGVFEPITENIELFKNKTVLITDDIVTGGSTLSEAAKTLLIFGADKVYGVAAVMTPKKKSNNTAKSN